MKKGISWLALAAILLIVIVIFAYRAGYVLGSDMAERDNRAEAVE
ncbi:MAG: hypothetical protein QNI87_00400 [Erythrobacter sp.]|nr:hypothetical protein [Erythrobacter sp.]